MQIAHDVIHMNVSSSTCLCTLADLFMSTEAAKLCRPSKRNPNLLRAKKIGTCKAGERICHRARCSASSPALVSMLALLHQRGGGSGMEFKHGNAVKEWPLICISVNEGLMDQCWRSKDRRGDQRLRLLAQPLSCEVREKFGFTSVGGDECPSCNSRLVEKPDQVALVVSIARLFWTVCPVWDCFCSVS